jgi:ribosomal protein S18 acetylase RimI-like enzyme
MMEPIEITIAEMSPARQEDYLAFFDRDAFADNPPWASCYCYFHFAAHDRQYWKDRMAEQNRSAIIDRIQRAEVRGYLAYADGKPIGWCNADLPTNYSTLETAPPPQPVGAIVCFIVAKAYRGLGVASRLLDAACAGLAGRGIEVVDAYARKDTEDEAANHHGPLAMYLDTGFVPVGENGPLVTVRKSVSR